jgi:formylglycine-generating enzyme required for sulfatase activity
MQASSRFVVLGLVALTFVVERDAAGDQSHSCREEEKDARGDCPAGKPQPKPPLAKPSPTKPASPRTPVSATQLDIRITDPSIADAKVSLDAEPKGLAPLLLATVAGRHQIEVVKDGYVTFSEWVTVKAGESTVVKVTLSPSTTPAATPAKPISCPADMVAVAAGSFLMGSVDNDGEAVEHPQHKVTLAAYCVDKTEVTATAFNKCVSAGGCQAGGAGRYCNGAAPAKGNHPINCVTWDHAKTYCGWAGKRLPTEAEWEYAARGGDGRRYPWGNEGPDNKRLHWNTTDGTKPVGSYANSASPSGALDMAGNVWEWVADWYGPYTSDAQTNPSGPSSGTRRVLRGGGWNNAVADLVRSTHRVADAPSLNNFSLGFRCASGN